jgi:hypothetical protein
MRGTDTESVNELGSDAPGRRKVLGTLAAGGGQPGPLPLARERTGRGPLPAAPMPRTWPQHTPP